MKGWMEEGGMDGWRDIRRNGWIDERMNLKFVFGIISSLDDNKDSYDDADEQTSMMMKVMMMMMMTGMCFVVTVVVFVPKSL